MMLDAGNSSIRLCDLLEKAAHYWPQKPALTFADKTFTWRETAERCRGVANMLAAAGVVRGDRVAFLGYNSHRCFESYYAPAYLGAMLVPINHRLSVREMIECVDDASPLVLITDAQHLENALAIQEACACIKTLIYAEDGAAPRGTVSYELGLRGARDTRLTPSQGDETLIMFYTGGTTGRSKGVMLSNTNLYANTIGTIPLYKIVEGETFLIAGPMFHLAAGARVFPATAMGGHVIVLPRFDATAVLNAIQKYRISSVTLVPTMFQLLFDHPQFKQFDLSSLRMVTYGAAPMPMALMRRIIENFSGAEIYQSYGMTEASPVVTVLDCKYHCFTGTNAKRNAELLTSVGRPVHYVDIRIVDENDQPVANGHTGEIVVRGANIMTGYWQLPDITASALRNGWYHTGDGGFFDAEGFLFLAGRVKDMVVSGGENVYPIEVENVLSDHPAVHQCAVIGIPHPTWGEAVHAVISLKPAQTVSEQELIAFCRERLAHYKCPVSATIQSESLPLSAVNKILKSELRKPFWAGRDSEII
jgi:acyl-CoA synthetase (AMP-forming)/AMP-acid ligase II